MSTSASKNSDSLKKLKPNIEECPSPSNPAKLVKTPKVPVKVEYSLRQSPNRSPLKKCTDVADGNCEN